MMSDDSSAACIDNRPPMLEESDYESWKIRIERYIKETREMKNSLMQRISKNFVIFKRLIFLVKTLDRRKEDLFDEYEHFHANGNELIQDYFIHFHKLINDMKVTKLTIPTHQMNTKFVNNLPRTRAPTHSTTTSPSQLTPALSSTSSSTAQSHDDAMSSSNIGTHAMVHDGQITTESVQRRALGNTGNMGYRGHLNNGQGVNNKKKVICYNCHGERHVARQCKEPKHPKDSLWHQDKAMLLQAKENGAVLNAEAEAFLANVECTVPLAEPLALTTTNISSQINEVRIFNDNIFETVSPSWPSEVPQDEHLDSDDDSVHKDYTIPYDQYLATKESQDVPTKASPIPPTAAYMLQTLTDLTTQVEGHRKFNQEQALVNATLSAELDQCLGLSNPWFGRKAQLSQPTLYDGHRILQPGHAPVTVSDSHETLLETEVTRMKMSQKPGHVTPVDYTKLNALYDQFAPQKELFREQILSMNKIVLANKNLQIEKKNLLIKNECLISNSISKDIYSIVLASVNIVPPISDCMCVELRTSCDREHNRVLELEDEISTLHNMLKESEKCCVFIQKEHIDLQVKFQNFKECANSNATPLNAIFEINKLKDQIQGDKTIRNLESKFNISRMLKTGSPIGSLEKNALETEITQLKDNITSLRIQNDGYKIEIANRTRRGSGTKVSGPKTPEKPKVLAPGMYAISSKYITPPRRGDCAPPTPKKKHSFKPVAQITKNDAGTSTIHIPGPVTTEEKAQKKNDVKARKNGNSFLKTQIVEGVETVMPFTSAKGKAQRRLEVKVMSTLMMGIPNEHQLKFNSIKDAKSPLKAIKKSLPSEWNMHVVVWRNKPDLDSMSMDGLYNNLKVYEPEVKGVTENGNSFLKTQIVEGVETVMPFTSAKDKAQRRLEVKVMSALMMGIPNEHQLKFNSIKDAKSPLKAIKKRLKKVSCLRFGIQEGVLGCGLCSRENFLVAFCLGHCARFGVAFCVLRFSSVVCLIQDPIAFCQGEALPNSNLHCILSQLQLRFISRHVAFYLKTRCVLCQSSLRFISKLVAFCLKTRCVLSQESLCFVSKLVAFCLKARCVLSQDSLRFVSRLIAFCLKTRCVLSQDSLRFVLRIVAFCLLRFVYRSSLRLAIPLQLTFHGEPDLPIPVLESFHEQTDEELTENDIKRIDADDQAVQIILLGLL
nr:ribonuclease H-like domain-containing protein [Tanacetum cinerariifolium]